MHELSLVKHLVALVEQHARAHGATRVRAVDLAIGEQSHLLPESVQFYFDQFTAAGAPDSPARGAVLRFRRVPFTLDCPSCRRTFEPRGETFDCPTCGAPGLLCEAADEILLESLEVEP